MKIWLARVAGIEPKFIRPVQFWIGGHTRDRTWDLYLIRIAFYH